MKLSQIAPARVSHVVNRSTIQLIVLPGVGLADGGIPRDVPLELVPLALRMPNTMLTVKMEGGAIVEVRAQDAET